MADNKKIKTSIHCQAIAPIENLSKEISSNSLKIGIFANNGSGKTFISRLFRLTEVSNELKSEEDGKSPTDKIIAFGKNRGEFSFKIIDKEGNVTEDFSIQIKKGKIPVIPNTKYIYHTFNEDYVEENISSLSYDKESEIEGYILGKINIDLKDEEEKLAKIEKEKSNLSEQIVNEINAYVTQNISSIQNIKRLNEYKLLEPQNIFNGINKDEYPVLKSFDKLIEDYNKIKSVPENLNDINLVTEIKIDFNIFQRIKEESLKEYSLSSLAEDFKMKIKSKQSFIESGMNLLEKSSNKDKCPFCEQKLESDANRLIDNYTEYLNDVEAKTIKLFNEYKTQAEKLIENFKSIENTNTKCINEFNSYKTKYIPSSEKIELKELKSDEIKDVLREIIALIVKKLNKIDAPISIEDELIQSLKKNQTLFNKQIGNNNKEIKNINSKKNEIGEENKNIRKEICKQTFNHLVKKQRANVEIVNKLRNDWNILNDQIKKKKEQQKVLKRKKVASTIKKVLNYFFADKYTLDEDTFRLVFHKNTLEKMQAKDVLSAGEKNIVAFAYFIGDTHLKIETEDDYSKLFFVLDDPISSMDFSHVYTLCGVIRDLNKIFDKLDRERILIFTHNNDFMRVISSNSIVDKKLLLKNNELKEFNNNLTVPYINHLIDIYNVARKGLQPTHTTANSIRHIVETLAKFEKIDSSRNSIVEYIKDNIPDDSKSYTLINDLSHGGWRSEQAPITNEDYVLMCETMIKHIEKKYKGQIDYCANE
jgi:hypothetical protein